MSKRNIEASSGMENDPSKIPVIYSRVTELILADQPGGINILRTDDGGEIRFILAPGARTLQVQEKTASAQRIAARFINVANK
jgi:hypothetical protein